jgi:hypothetical protein
MFGRSRASRVIGQNNIKMFLLFLTGTRKARARQEEIYISLLLPYAAARGGCIWKQVGFL